MTEQPYRPILATLGYVVDVGQQTVLMIHRNKRPTDAHFGKYNGLGGKVQRDEHVVCSLRREILEESGLHCDQVELAGTISWPGFGSNGEDWLGFVFIIEQFHGTALTECSEGTLSWKKITELEELHLWEGDRQFLPLVFAKPRRQFHGVMPYSAGKPLSWNYTLL